MVNETTLNEAQMSILRLLGSMKTVEEVDELRLLALHDAGITSFL